MRLVLCYVVVLGAASVAAQENSGSITGTVGDASGLPLRDATVSIVSPISRQVKGKTWGEFVIDGLAPGAYKLTIERDGFRVKDLDVSVEAGKETSLGRVVLDVKWTLCLGDANKPRISEMKLPAGGKPGISGTVRVEAGGGLRDLTITLFEAGAATAIAQTITGENGEFRIEDVKPGTYDVAVSAGAGLFLFAETVAKVQKLRVREGHALKILLPWQPRPPGQICL
jgi:hypothetical protein